MSGTLVTSQTFRLVTTASEHGRSREVDRLGRLFRALDRIQFEVELRPGMRTGRR